MRTPYLSAEQTSRSIIMHSQCVVEANMLLNPQAIEEEAC